MRRTVLTGLGLMLCVSAAPALGQSNPATPNSMKPAIGAGDFTVGVDALAWWFKDPASVPLISNDILGESGTRVLLDGTDDKVNTGFRLNAGYGITDRVGMEASIFYFPSQSHTTGADSGGQAGGTELVLPYVDATTGQETGTQISLEPVYRGIAHQQMRSKLLGAEINGSYALQPVGAWQIDLLGGVRYLKLQETLHFTTSSNYNPPYPQDIWESTDDFGSSNRFFGAQVGARARMQQGKFFGGGSVKLAVGRMSQSVDIDGSLVTNDFNNYGATQTFAGGYFALPTNIGHYSRSEFAVVPEIALNLGYQVTPKVAVLMSYSFLYASNVLRPGDQINRTINTSQATSYTEDPAAHLVGPAQPAFKFNDSNFWAQGVSIALSVRF